MCSISLLSVVAWIKVVFLTASNIKDLDVLLDELQLKTRSLTYLSLLGNTACPNQLSSSDKDDDDYNRYRLLYSVYNLDSNFDTGWYLFAFEILWNCMWSCALQ